MWKRIFIAYALFLHYWFVSLRFVKLIVMDREQLFKDFKEKCVKRPEICGQGNPNADILIIGKEPAGEEFEDTNCQEYLDFLKGELKIFFDLYFFDLFDHFDFLPNSSSIFVLKQQ